VCVCHGFVKSSTMTCSHFVVREVQSVCVTVCRAFYQVGRCVCVYVISSLRRLNIVSVLSGLVSVYCSVLVRSTGR